MDTGMGGAITAVAATTTVGTAAITMVGTAATTTAGGIIVVGDEQTKKREENCFGSLWEHRFPGDRATVPLQHICVVRFLCFVCPIRFSKGNANAAP